MWRWLAVFSQRHFPMHSKSGSRYHPIAHDDRYISMQVTLRSFAVLPTAQDDSVGLWMGSDPLTRRTVRFRANRPTTGQSPLPRASPLKAATVANCFPSNSFLLF